MYFPGRNKRMAIGVDVGSRCVKAVQMSHGGAGWRVEATAAFPRTATSAALDPAEVRRLAGVLGRRSFIGQDVVLAVPGEMQISGTMELPPRGKGVSLDAAARTEFCRAYKREFNTFEMTYWDLPTPARAAKATHVMAVACPHRDADALIDLFAAEGLDVVGLDARAWAMTRACGNELSDTDGIVLLLELGWNGALLVIVHHGVVIYERSLSEGGLSALHRDLQAELKIEPDVVDFALGHTGLLPLGIDKNQNARDVNDVPIEMRGDVRALAAAHFERVGQELMASVSYTTHQYPDAAATRLLLLGGGAMIPGISDYLQGVTGIECRAVTPLATASCAPAIARECNAALMTAAGLAQFQERRTT
jgi:Tfp pilus assembly PilM family ATPase